MDKKFYGLWYIEPAVVWADALPIGNGRLGASLFGGIQHETIILNQENVWDGKRNIDRTNPDAYEKLREIREAIFNEEYKKADTISYEMLGIPANLDSYQPLCRLEIEIGNIGLFKEYKRYLDIENAVCSSEYRITGEYSEYGSWYQREAFVSCPDNLLVMRWDTEFQDGIMLNIGMSRFTPISVEANEAYLRVSGRTREEGICFAAVLHVTVTGGALSEANEKLIVRKAKTVEFRIAAATDFTEDNPADVCMRTLNAAENYSYAQLKERHIFDYQRLYKRQKLTLGADEPLRGTKEMLENFRQGGHEDKLFELEYNYLRYLIISSSRPGSQPSNLQGIWNDNMKAPWNSDFHPNVNMQINYWPVEGFGLTECFEPVVDWLIKLLPSAQKTAVEHYRARGWVLHHISDIFGCTTPMDGPWGLWPLGGAWLCRHLYEHYRYTEDEVFLKDKAMPLIEGSVYFMLDFLMECPKGLAGEGHLITCPSHSPENMFLNKKGEACNLTYAATMDMQVIRDLFTIYLECLKIIGKDSEIKQQVQEAKAALVPTRISEKTGCIMEWVEDYVEQDPGHRHVSHLYGLYPGEEIKEEDKALRIACENTLERRLASNYDGNGWNYGWIATLFARLKNGERMLDILDIIGREMLLNNLCIYAHGNPQVGDAQSIAAAIQEALVQSHADVVEILPALPKRWKNGRMEGLIIRGGHCIDLEWAEGKILHMKLTAAADGELKVKADLQQVLTGQEKIPRLKKGDAFLLKLKRGEIYWFD